MLNAASAWRVKYRDIKSPSGEKIRARVENFGVHRKNRAGAYPSGIRCKDLCKEVISHGFLKEEYTDKLVVVEEMPLHEAQARQICETGSQYNRECSSKDELLQPCFQEPRGNVQYNLLSHNHMSLVVLAFIAKAKWDMPIVEQPNMKTTITFCDDQGRLSLAAVAATANGKELQEIVNEGVDCEVLSWKMEVEEPTAAAVISGALNKCSDFAMRTTEWSALYTLKGGIIAASGKLGERVAFASLVEQTHMELDSAALDPDLDQLFDFLINIGVGHNTFFDDLANFQQVFIDSNRRQLRFSAFGVVNKLPVEIPRVKIAIIKRAYWKKTKDDKSCWCGNPEAAWAAVAAPILRCCEDLLLYVHESDDICKKIEPAVEKKDSHKRIAFYAKVDIDVASALMATVVAHKGKPPIDDVRQAMLKAASKHMMEIKYSTKEPPPTVPDHIKWFAAGDLLDKVAVAADTAKTAEVPTADTKAKVEVIQFDQRTGLALNQQVTFETAKKGALPPIELPWKEWHNEHRGVAQTMADKAAIVTMIENLHRQWDTGAVQVQIMSAEGKIHVLAGANMEANSLLLPACVPNGCRVSDVSNEHPLAVRVSVGLSEGTKDDVSADGGPSATLARRVEYVLLPEFKAPAQNPKHEGKDEPAFKWSKDYSESMHPFWAVRRIPRHKLEEEQKAVLQDIRKTGIQRNVPAFNCEIVSKVHPTMCIASMGTQSVTSTRFVTMPFMTNTKAVVRGEELICELAKAKKPQVQKKRDWRDVVREEEAQAKKKPKASSKKP